MTIFDTTAYEVSQETFEFAQKIAVNSKNETSRKRIYGALICLRTLAEYFTSEGYTIDLENNLFRIMPLNEELECNDLRGNGRCIDVRTVVNGKYILIPKSYYKYGVLPDLFAVAKYNQDDKTVNFLGCIEPLQVEKQRQNEKYFIMDTSQLIQPFQIEDRIKLVKNTKISDQNHDLYVSYFIDYVDGVLSEENKKKLFNHLFECKGCRERFADFYNCESVAKLSSEYPQILQDQMLNIVGATAVNNEKYKDYEEITLEIDKEPDKYAEEEEENKADDPLQVLYGKKGLNTDVFNSFKQKSLLSADKKPKSMLDSVLADIPKLPVNDTEPEKTSFYDNAAEEYNSANITNENSVKTGKINPSLYQEDYSDGIISNDENEDEVDYIEDIVTPEPDPAIYNNEEDEPLFLNELNPKTEQTSAVDEMILLDAPVSPDISNFANFKKSDSDVSVSDEDDVIIINDEEDSEENRPAQITKPSILDKAMSSVQTSKMQFDDEKDTGVIDEENSAIVVEDISDEPTSAFDKYENVDEKDLVHFDVEEVDLVDEVGSQYVVDKKESEQESLDDVLLINPDDDKETSNITKEDEKTSEDILVLSDDNEEEQLLLNDDNHENEISKTVTEEHASQTDNFDLDIADINIDIGDGNPLFQDMSAEGLSNNPEPDLDIKPAGDSTNIDDFLNSDLLNIGDIEDMELSLDYNDKVKTPDDNAITLSSNDMFSDIGDDIPNMYDNTETYNKEEQVQEEDDEDDAIILVDDNNKPITSYNEPNNAESGDLASDTDEDDDIVLITDDKTGKNDEDDEIVLINDDEDDGTNFVRPASVSDLNSKFMMEDNEDNIKKDDIDDLDDDVTFINHEEENSDDTSFFRPAGTMVQGDVSYGQTEFQNEQKIQNDFDNIGVLFGNKTQENAVNNEEATASEVQNDLRENTIKYDEDGFEITDDESEDEESVIIQNNADEEQTSADFEEVAEAEEYDGAADSEESEDEYSEESDEEYEESEDEEESTEAEEVSDNKKNMIKKAAIIALIALVGLGSVGGGLFFYINKSKQEQMKNIAALNSLNEESASTENAENNPDESMNLNDDGIQLPAEGENSEIAGQMPPQENAAPEPEQLPESPSVAPQVKDEPKPKDMNQAMTNAFSNNPSELRVTKTSWVVAPYIVSDADFKAFLQTSGRAIQAEIKNNLTTVRDNTYSENTKVQIIFNEGVIKDIVISKSSGSKQIDEIVLQSVKDYMANVQLPKLSDNTVEAIKKANGNYSFKITLSVNF